MENSTFVDIAKQFYVPSSSLCVYMLIASSLLRGVDVEILSKTKVVSLSSSLNIRFKSNYHRVGNILKLSYKGDLFYLNKSRFFNSDLGYKFSKSSLKSFDCKLINSSKILVPPGISFNKNHFSDKLSGISNIPFPLVVKPTNGSMGRGVVLNNMDLNDVESAIRAIEADNVIVEQQLFGDEYRVYVVLGKFYAAVKRIKPFVTGDGKSSLLELLSLKNSYKLLNKLPLIDVDTVSINLSRKGISLDYVPPLGDNFILCDKLGRSSGGDIIDVTNTLPDWFIQEVNIFSKQFSNCLCIGLDLILSSRNLYLLEVNNRPQLSSIILPDVGPGKNIADFIVYSLFPNAFLSNKYIKNISALKSQIRSLKKNGSSVFLKSSDFIE